MTQHDMSSNLIVIVGITGTQGGSVADTYLSEPGWRIRGITRNTSSPAAQHLSSQGIEMIHADLNDTPSLIAAFHGAAAVFAVTDFWQLFFDPATPSKLKPGQIINQYCHDLEIQQGKNLANAAATVETLERYVYSGLTDFGKWSGGKYTWVYHFDGKAKVVEYIKGSLPGLREKMSVVQVGLYYTHWQTAPFLAPQKQPDGTFVLSLTADPDAPMPMIDTRKDTGNFVLALIKLSPGKNLLAYGTIISWKDYMTLWAKILNLPGGSYKQVTIDEVDKIAPGGLGREIGEGWAAQGEFGYDGGDPTVLHPKDLDIGIPVTSLEDYIKSEDWSAVIG